MAETEWAFGCREETGGGETHNSVLHQTPEQTVLMLQQIENITHLAVSNVAFTRTHIRTAQARTVHDGICYPGKSVGVHANIAAHDLSNETWDAMLQWKRVILKCVCSTKHSRVTIITILQLSLCFYQIQICKILHFINKHTHTYIHTYI